MNDFLKFFSHICIIIYIIQKINVLNFWQQFKIVHDLKLKPHNFRKKVQ